MIGIVKKLVLIWMILGQGFVISWVHAHSVELSGQDSFHCFAGIICDSRSLQDCEEYDCDNLLVFTVAEVNEKYAPNVHNSWHHETQGTEAEDHCNLLIIDSAISYNCGSSPLEVIHFAALRVNAAESICLEESICYDQHCVLLDEIEIPLEEFVILYSTDTSPPSVIQS